jgi:hypothetical protein
MTDIFQIGCSSQDIEDPIPGIGRGVNKPNKPLNLPGDSGSDPDGPGSRRAPARAVQEFAPGAAISGKSARMMIALHTVVNRRRMVRG